MNGTLFLRAKNWGNAMFKPRYSILCFALAVSILWPSASRADQAFQRFLPLLVDLGGWEGKKPDGMSMEMANVSMTTATRDYQKGSAQLHASVMIGQTAGATLAPLQNGMNVQTSEGHMVTGTMHGMPVLKSFNTKDKSGSLMVGLGKEALFTIAYDGLSEDEALALAEKFDWKALQAATQAK
jgi:hypothetical protein